MRTCSLTLDEACRFLDSRKQIYARPKFAVLIVGIEDEDGTLHGVFIAERVTRSQARLAHVYADGSPGGFSLLYGTGWRALKAQGFRIFEA